MYLFVCTRIWRRQFNSPYSMLKKDAQIHNQYSHLIYLNIPFAVRIRNPWPCNMFCITIAERDLIIVVNKRLNTLYSTTRSVYIYTRNCIFALSSATRPPWAALYIINLPRIYTHFASRPSASSTRIKLGIYIYIKCVLRHVPRVHQLRHTHTQTHTIPLCHCSMAQRIVIYPSVVDLPFIAAFYLC